MKENCGNFVECLSKIYSILVAYICVIYFLMVFICLRVLKRGKNAVIYRYIYTNAICDTILAVISTLGFYCIEIPFERTDFPSHIVDITILYAVRVLHLFSAIINVEIMSQRYLFIKTQKYLLLEKTNTVIFSTLMSCFFLLIPSYITDFIRYADEIKSEGELYCFGFVDIKKIALYFSIFKETKEYFSKFYNTINILLIAIITSLSIFTVGKLFRTKNLLYRNDVQLNSINVLKHEDSYSTESSLIKTNSSFLYDKIQLDKVKINNRVTFMIFFMTIFYIFFQLVTLFLTQIFYGVQFSLRNYKIYYVLCNIVNFSRNFLTIYLFFKYDRTISYYLRSPFNFYRNYFRRIKRIFSVTVR